MSVRRRERIRINLAAVNARLVNLLPELDIGSPAAANALAEEIAVLAACIADLADECEDIARTSVHARIGD